MGRLYQDQRTGIRVLLVAALVRNRSGLGRTYSNIGIRVPSVDGNDSQTSTSDLSVLSRPRLLFCRGSSVGVYAPPQ
jgi:hypothetical protein